MYGDEGEEEEEIKAFFNEKTFSMLLFQLSHCSHSFVIFLHFHLAFKITQMDSSKREREWDHV